MKTFKKLMETENFENGICVGSKTNFFYIGEQNYEEVDKALKDYLLDVKKFVEKNTKKCVNFAVNGVVLGENDEVNQKKIEARIRNFYSAANALRTGRNYINNFKKLSSRKVKEIYERETDGRTVILIDGEENGNLWFFYEKK